MPISPIPPAILQQAQVAADNQDYRAAADILGRACQAMPGHFQLRLFHASAVGQCGEYAHCRRLFKGLLEDIHPSRRDEFKGVLGTIWRNMGRNDLAEPLLRAAAQSPAGPAGAHEAWIDALERLNRVEEGVRVLVLAKKKFPGQPSLDLLAGRLHRREGDLARAESALRRCLGMPGTPPALAMETRYELGHTLDAMGRHAEAFAFFQAAKAGPRAAAVDELRGWQSRLAHLRDFAGLPTESDFRRWAGTPPPSGMRQAFLVGSPRSGTTLLERVLDAHPDIVAAPETPIWRGDVWFPLLKEFQDSGLFRNGAPSERELLDAVTVEQIHVGFKTYRRGMDAVMERTIGPNLLVDKNPSYFSLIVPIARMFPSASLLVALRDPRAIVWSCFTQSLPINPESVAYLDLATAVEQTKVWLERWLLLRGRLAMPWREVRYESVVRDLAGESGKTLQFLGVSWDEKVMAFHKSQKPVHSPSYASASKPIHAGAIDKWRHYEKFLSPHLEPLKPVMERLGYAWDD